MMRRLVAIHELPCMRLVLPAFVCSVGNRVVAMDASRLGSRCSFMGSPINPPSGYPRGLVVAVRASTGDGWAAAGVQRLVALPSSFRVGCWLWARSQWTKAIDGDAAAHERKKAPRMMTGP